MIYNEALCMWCWDYDEHVKADWRVTEKSDDRVLSYSLCDGCYEGPLQQAVIDAAQQGFDLQIVGAERISDEPLSIFRRGERVEIRQPRGPILIGTVLHCYLSKRHLKVQANVLIDYRKWPTILPASCLERYAPAPQREHAQ